MNALDSPNCDCSIYYVHGMGALEKTKEEIAGRLQITSHSLYIYLCWVYKVSVEGLLEAKVNQLKPWLCMMWKSSGSVKGQYACCHLSIPYPVDNSDSPSVVEQSQQGISFSCICLLLFLISGSVEYPMPYASCLASCIGGGDYPVAGLILMEFCLSPGTLLNGALLIWPLGLLQSPFYWGYFTLHPGIACLVYVHYGIACLASWASYWAGALWDGLSGLWLVSLC